MKTFEVMFESTFSMAGAAFEADSFRVHEDGALYFYQGDSVVAVVAKMRWVSVREVAAVPA